MQEPNVTPLKVLMTADAVGGVWTYAMELCRLLQVHGVHFYLVTTGAPLQHGQWNEVNSLPNVTVCETTYKLEWMHDSWSDIDRSGAWLLELEKELKPDVIHLNSFSYGALHFEAPKIVVAHSDVFSWWQAVHGTTPPAEWNEYYHRVMDGLNGAHLIIAPSKAMMDAIEAIYNPAPEKRVVYNFRDAGHFSIAKKRPEVMAMGRIWDEAKNVQLLLQAAPHMGYTIKLAGDAIFEDNVLGTGGSNVVYLGKLNGQQVAAHLSTASVFVLPARYEPFGLSALEAALSGCALVLGNIASLREIWQDAAIYVDTDDATSMAVVINKLLCDEAMCDNFAQKAYNRAQQFTGNKGAGQYLSIYQQLLQQKTLYQQEIA